MASSPENAREIVLRSYQQRDEDRIRYAFKRTRSVLYVAPTGSGKTILFCDLAARVLERGKRVLIVCHRHELIEQISEALQRFNIQHGIIASGVQRSLGYGAQVSSVRSLTPDSLQWTPDLVIIDEAHHIAGRNAWARVVENYPGAYRLGVTATPCRTDGRSLAQFFGSMVIGPSYRELEDEGYLTNLEAWAPPLIDMSGAGVRGGEYAASDIVERATRPCVTGDAIRHYERLGRGRRAIVFDVSIDSARRRAESFLSAGFRAEAIDGTQTHTERSSAVARFRAGTTQILVSVDLVSEGFDLPAIEVGISLRPTLSLGLWMQQAGRILRPMEGKSVATLLDHAGNIGRFGFPNDDRDWTLDSATATRERGQPQRIFRICPACFLASLGGPRFCPGCGAPFPIKARQVAQRKGELAPVTNESRAAFARISAFARTRQAARTFEGLAALGRQRGMKHPELWARHVLKSRGKS